MVVCRAPVRRDVAYSCRAVAWNNSGPTGALFGRPKIHLSAILGRCDVRCAKSVLFSEGSSHVGIVKHRSPRTHAGLQAPVAVRQRPGATERRAASKSLLPHCVGGRGAADSGWRLVRWGDASAIEAREDAWYWGVSPLGLKPPRYVRSVTHASDDARWRTHHHPCAAVCVGGRGG